MLEEIKFDNKKNRPKGKENRGDRSSNDIGGNDRKRMQVNLQECEQLSEKAVDLIFNNKINAKNAFDVNVEYLERLPHLLKKNEETSWQKASASLDASAKIYGYRVDSVHSETFKFLGGLSRAEAKEGNEEGDEDKRRKNRDGRHDGFSTLESDPKKLDLVKYDLEFEVDPLFKSMTAKFGDSGARGLLLKTLPLDVNIDVLLESKDEEFKQKMTKIPTEISQEIKSILNDALSNFPLIELRNLQLCPDLTYFKKERDLESSLEKTFYQNLMQEFDETLLRDNILRDESNLDNSLDNSINLADQIEDNMEMSSMSHRSSYESNLSARFDENINTNMINISQDIQKMMGVSYFEGFSYLKSDDIKEYIHHFGDGNKDIFKNIPHYTNFTKSFNQLEKFNSYNPANLLDTKKDKKPKKEEKLFDFLEEKEILKLNIFEKESTMKKVVLQKEHVNNTKKYRKKVKQFYHYDRSVLFNLFSIQDRLINDKFDVVNHNGYPNPNHQDNFSVDNDDEMPHIDEHKNNFAETFMKIDSEYEKKFGRLYKTFDVRLVKGKIWESISSMNDNNILQNFNNNSIPIEFKQILDSVTSNLPREVVNNISTPTCFVCLLHLSNEKNLVLEEVDENSFTIRQEEENKNADIN